MSGSRQEEARLLAEELLGDIELRRIASTDVVRKASRLARLTDDADALEWLHYEIVGYGEGRLDAAATDAANRSARRAADDDDGSSRYWTASLAHMEANIASNRAVLPTLTGDLAGDKAWVVERDRRGERQQVSSNTALQQEVIDRVVGTIYVYVSTVYQALRFGSAAETAFEVVRRDVDLHLSTLIPGALPKLSAAYENASSSNPEHWANASSTCRRLLKAAADALRPPGDDKGGRKMTDEAYINRLADWIESQATSETAAAVVVADLEYLGRRLDAVNDAGHKGAHAEVARFDASRFVVGTYLVLGDILRLKASESESHEKPNLGAESTRGLPMSDVVEAPDDGLSALGDAPPSAD